MCVDHCANLCNMALRRLFGSIILMVMLLVLQMPTAT